MSHRAAPLALAAALALGAGLPARAQEEPRKPAPDKAGEGAATREAKRVLDRFAEILEATERNDAAAAARALRDASWLVRKLAALRLEVIGLDPRVAAELKAAAAPEKPALAEGAPLLAKADAYAAAVAPKKEPVEEVSAFEAVRAVSAFLESEVSRGRAGEEAKREIVSSLEVFATAAADPESRRFLARRILVTADREAILKDLGARTDDDASREHGKKLFEWWRSNARFCYFARREGRFRLDREARAAGEASAEFRKKKPWKEGEGPDAPPREGAGEGR